MATQRLELGVARNVFEAAIARFESKDGVRRLWERDASLWTDADEASWLGWLDLPEAPASELEPLHSLARSARDEGIRQVVVVGMGGSSLCPDVLAHSFEPAPGYPRTLVLDSTVPAQIAALEAALDLPRAWFVVSSKSGSTIEPNSLFAYFYARAVECFGEREAGARFIAITDPGSRLETVARECRFRASVPGVASVGGRFSALSAFGLLPAALQGLDLGDWLGRAREMARACGPGVPTRDNPGALLGLAIGALAAAGRDKLVLAISPGLSALGGWLEQLVAESTGKHGRGIVPIDGGTLPTPDEAGDDCLFVYTRLASAPDAAQDAAIAALEAAEVPLVRIDVDQPLDLAAELFRWEVATAVAGAELELNPFDQPDVEAAKVAARSLMTAYQRDGSLPDTAPLRVEAGFTAFADEALGDPPDLEAAIARHFARTGPGDYVAINAYLERNDANAALLGRMRQTLARKLGVPTTLGYGPRFLHSTGQLHKGGPNTGVFLQLTSDDASPLAIPGQGYSFGVLKQAQSLGDFAVLCERGRRALRIHLASDVTSALEELAKRIEHALGRPEQNSFPPTP
ncbi:MAG: transaldolase [Myxococcota bacterium]|nr:transaldolase [Myxococcota bacterium]